MKDNKESDLFSHPLPANDGTVIGAMAISTLLLCMIVGPLVPLLLGVMACWNATLSFTLSVVILVSAATSRHSASFCRFILKGASYLNGVTLHIEKRSVKAMGDSPGMWCLHPHGTSIGYGFVLNGAVRFRAHDEPKFVPECLQEQYSIERIRRSNGVQAPILFYVPLVRNMLLSLGCATPATKHHMHKLFSKQIDFGILPGGMEEVALFRAGCERVYLRHRAGFIKYALQHGYLVVIGYTFGESDMYSSLAAGSSLKMWMQRRLGFIVPIFWGPLWYAPWLPRRDVPINTVLTALQLPKIASPTASQVTEWHDKYMESLHSLFEKHKSSFRYGDRELEIM